VLTTGGLSVVVRRGAGDGSFGPASTYRVGPNPFDVELVDINHDGTLDVAAANYGNGNWSQDFQYDYGTVSVLLGIGDGTLGRQTQYPTGSGSSVDAVALADFDGDGHVDLAAPDWVGPIVRRGRGDGRLLKQLNVRPDLCTGGGAAVADFDRDGLTDLAIGGTCFEDATTAVIYVFLNRTGRPCVVPDVRFLHRRRVPVVLNGAGCRLHRVGYRYSREHRRGVVISQNPGPGATLAIDAPIEIVVSRGRSR
jgi:hypothetical protein